LVQVHQTKYLVEIGMSPAAASFALGFVGLGGIVGQIGLGHLSDSIGREWAWTLAGLGYMLCYALLLLLRAYPWPVLMYAMVASQGMLGYGLASVYGAIPAEIFHGRAYASIFGSINMTAALGAGAGPWVAGLSQDLLGSYTPAFWLALAVSALSILSIWMAAPRRGGLRRARA
ncbi:MAG TPA: MFS transporter, partial [bacterium]|nr:MFS transporter [bacterium]